jgi:hypothetical protein
MKQLYGSVCLKTRKAFGKNPLVMEGARDRLSLAAPFSFRQLCSNISASLSTVFQFRDEPELPSAVSRNRPVSAE